jgi:hypothetical protein
VGGDPSGFPTASTTATSSTAERKTRDWSRLRVSVDEKGHEECGVEYTLAPSHSRPPQLVFTLFPFPEWTKK